MKKKLSALIAAALCVTVGGVYATWQYAEDGAKEATADLAIGIATTGASTTKGTIDIIGIEDIGVSIDHDLSGDAQSDALYKAYLLWSTKTEVEVAFTPSVNNTTEPEIKMSCTLTENFETYTYEYKGTQNVELFRFKASETATWDDCASTADSITFELNNGDPCATTTIDLSKYLILNPDLQVPTSKLHSELDTYLFSNNRKLTIKVFETPANNA